MRSIVIVEREEFIEMVERHRYFPVVWTNGSIFPFEGGVLPAQRLLDPVLIKVLLERTVFVSVVRTEPRAVVDDHLQNLAMPSGDGTAADLPGITHSRSYYGKRANEASRSLLSGRTWRFS